MGWGGVFGGNVHERPPLGNPNGNLLNDDHLTAFWGQGGFLGGRARGPQGRGGKPHLLGTTGGKTFWGGGAPNPHFPRGPQGWYAEFFKQFEGGGRGFLTKRVFPKEKDWGKKKPFWGKTKKPKFFLIDFWGGFFQPRL